MYCSTCGSQVAAGRTSCQTCGAAVARAPHVPYGVGAPQSPHTSGFATVRATQPGAFGETLSMCPRCGYRGDSIGYFSRGGHVAALVGLTVITGGAFGVGGIAYYLLRRDHRICPRCAQGWGKHGVQSVALMSPNGARMAPHEPAPPVEVRSSSRSGWSIFLFVLAAFFMFGAVAGGEAGMALFAAMLAGGGVLVQRKNRAEREKRREAIIQGLQLPVLKLAAQKGGRLTVTQVATEMGWPLPRAEKVLNSLDDGFRVMSDITDDGVIVYDFLELRAAAELKAPPLRPGLQQPPSGPQGNALSA